MKNCNYHFKPILLVHLLLFNFISNSQNTNYNLYLSDKTNTGIDKYNSDKNKILEEILGPRGPENDLFSYPDLGVSNELFISLSNYEKFLYCLIDNSYVGQACATLPEESVNLEIEEPPTILESNVKWINLNQLHLNNKISTEKRNIPCQLGWTEFEERRSLFLKNNKTSVINFIVSDSKAIGEIPTLFKEIILHINGTELIPWLINTYESNENKSDDEILTLLFLLMKENNYPPFVNSLSYDWLYGKNSWRYGYIPYNSANVKLTCDRAMGLYSLKEKSNPPINTFPKTNTSTHHESYPVVDLKKKLGEEFDADRDIIGSSIDDIQFNSLNLYEKAVYCIEYPEVYAQNCDPNYRGPYRPTDQRVIMAYLPEDDVYQLSERQEKFLTSNRATLINFIRSEYMDYEISNNLLRIIVMINGTELIPDLVDYYGKHNQESNDYTLSTLTLLMTNNKYPPFMVSKSYDWLYGKNSDRYGYIPYNSANVKLTCDRAMGLYSLKHR